MIVAETQKISCSSLFVGRRGWGYNSTYSFFFIFLALFKTRFINSNPSISMEFVVARIDVHQRKTEQSPHEHSLENPNIDFFLSHIC